MSTRTLQETTANHNAENKTLLGMDVCMCTSCLLLSYSVVFPLSLKNNTESEPPVFYLSHLMFLCKTVILFVH